MFLSLWLTKNCGVSDGSTSAIFDITVPDINARFTAPFRVVRGSRNIGDGSSERWVAGGNSFWRHDYGFSYTRNRPRPTPTTAGSRNTRSTRPARG